MLPQDAPRSIRERFRLVFLFDFGSILRRPFVCSFLRPFAPCWLLAALLLTKKIAFYVCGVTSRMLHARRRLSDRLRLCSLRTSQQALLQRRCSKVSPPSKYIVRYIQQKQQQKQQRQEHQNLFWQFIQSLKNYIMNCQPTRSYIMNCQIWQFILYPLILFRGCPPSSS